MGSKWDRNGNDLLGIKREFDGEKSWVEDGLKLVLGVKLKTGSKLRFKWEW